MEEIFVNQVLPILMPVVSALAGFLVAAFKCRTSILEKKINKILGAAAEPNFSNYYIDFEGKKIDLGSFNVKRKEVTKK